RSRRMAPPLTGKSLIEQKRNRKNRHGPIKRHDPEATEADAVAFMNFIRYAELMQRILSRRSD
ncbi:MAG TPA: hypothetical protein VIW67_04910, partial [Terriglobales bacterium]